MKVKTLLVCILMLSMMACKKKDNIVEEPLKVSIEPNSYDAAFYTNGETEILKIEPDAVGAVVTLKAGTDPSISYDATTEKVTWTKLLPLGTTVTTIEVIRNAQSATAELTLSNKFQGSFTGGYNFTPANTTLTSINFDLQFLPDSTISVLDDGFVGNGTWVVDNDKLQVTFTYSYDSAPSTMYSFRGTIIYDDDKAYIEGFWYRDSEIIAGMERGYFKVDLQ